MAFVVPLGRSGPVIDPRRLMGGHRTFRIGFDDVEVIDPAAVLDGADGAGLAEQDLRRVANAAVALLSLDLVGVGEACAAAHGRLHDGPQAGSAARSRPFRPHASGGGICISRWAAARLAAHSAVF